MFLHRLGWLAFSVQRREVLHQQAVDKDIAPTNATQKDAVRAVVEEGDGTEWEDVVVVEKPAQGVVLEDSATAQF
ncbi:hypothetical protein SE17_42840 [Kouleothrix aurantiaca]|uniref:Uncharacterized protein n=1 Tax=Kouleothrix aurantiaca TaxID=186479 RepID=A0A0P9GZE9_9CHLR|nr:hypothetical protein SE17_42840 [Kouleothrix aurantiaca]